MNSALVMWQQEKRPFLVLNFEDEGWNQDSAGTTLQAVHEGYCNLRTNLYLWRQYVSDPKHAETRVNTQ